MFLTIGEFFQKYGLVIALVLVGIIIVIVTFLLIRNKNKSKTNKASNELYEKIIEGLGGKENIISLEAKMSRLNVSLKDDNLLNIDLLKTSGVSRVVKMSSRITLLMGNSASEIEQAFKNNK